MPKDTNSVNDEIRQERKKVLETMTRKEKIKYFVGYYKFHALIALFVLIFLVTFIRDIVTSKDVKFEFVVVNGHAPDSKYEEIKEGFDATLDYNRKKEECKADYGTQIDPFDTSEYNQASIQRIFMGVYVKEVNVILCDEEFMRYTRAQDVSLDMEKTMPKEMLEKYKDKLVYYDFPVEECGDEPEYKDRYEAVCIDITDFKKIKETDMFPNKKAYAFVIYNTDDFDIGYDFIKYLDE